MKPDFADAPIDLEQPQPRPPTECPVEDWLSFLGHRWNALILWHLKHGSKRYGELTACLPGVAPKVLSERLRGLERRDLVLRSPATTFPRSVCYCLTPAGFDIVHILDQVEVWSRRLPSENHGKDRTAIE